MGMAFSIDAPLKVAHYGIDSVMSIGDDILLEKLRKMYCGKFNIPYQEISNKIEDFRAKRFTEYLNLVDKIVKEKFEDLKKSYNLSQDFQRLFQHIKEELLKIYYLVIF